ncbi:MAG: hypothetical protein LBN26_01305 [Christensenellaceae bacterium]|jgi:hypothetical protein|nr:hypothetical protein [Christensenellaceae bacterium]
MAQRKRRFGDRSDGRLIRSGDPMNRVSPYIMKTRNAASTYIADTVDIEEMERYIHEKRAQGLSDFGIMHVLLAAYVRGVSQRPGINRFVSGQKIFARNEIEVMLTVKRQMLVNAPETVMKIVIPPDATAAELYYILNDGVRKNKATQADSEFDSTAKILNYIPGVLLKFVVWLLNLMDYFGLLPRFLLKVSPFHASICITSMGSLGIPPIFHHLYDFGNVPVFCSFGAKQKRYEMQANGAVAEKKYIKYTFVTDERICDGFYYASALKLIKGYLKHPAVLDERPAQVIEDID